MTACPQDQRKTSYPGEAAQPAVEVIDGTWHIRSLELVRQVLRDTGLTQAGFASETVRASVTTSGNLPVLYLDGSEHKKQRTAIARYFAPVTVDQRYRELMEERADAILVGLDASVDAGAAADASGTPPSVDLSELTLHFSAQVAARVIGLTDSQQEPMAHRLVRFFDVPDAMLRPAGDPRAVRGLRRVGATIRSLPKLAQTLDFYLRDVRPAIRARRVEPQADVISHLIEQGYSDAEIVMECITYGAAGMVTTREFLQVAVWHVLERPDLRAAYLAADTDERTQILLEILRLEPVVGHLYRRAATDLVLEEGEVSHRIPQGALVDLYIRAANTDPTRMDAPLELCPRRELPKGIRPEVMSFGDGPHRCPGNAVAMTESEIFLTRLLSRDLHLVGTPHLEWEDLIAGYAVRNLRLRLAHPAPLTYPAPSPQTNRKVEERGRIEGSDLPSVEDMLRYLFRSAVAWTAMGLIGGLYYREFTKLNDFDFSTPTQLGVVHTHALTWGTIFMLVLIGLVIVMPRLARDAWTRWGVHLLNAGLVLTVGMMAFKGSVQVLGRDWADSPALAGVSGLGHMTLTASLIALLVAIGRGVTEAQTRLDGTHGRAVSTTETSTGITTPGASAAEVGR